jgi:predicted MFS family arabinose efflux permease
MFARYRRAFAGLPPAVWWLSTVTFINRSGTMVLPFLALFLSNQRGFTPTQIGIALATYGAGAMAGVTLGGWVSDRIDPRGVMIVSLLATGAGFLAVPHFASPLQLYGLLFVLGAFGESFRPANMAAIMRGVPPELRTRAVALLRLAINLGMSFGPAAGGILASFDYGWLFRVDALTCWAAAVLVIVLRRRGALAPHPTAQQAHDRSPLADRPFLALLALEFLVALVFFQINAAYPLRLRDGFGFDERAIGFTLAVNTVLIVSFEMLLVHRLERAPALRVAAWGSLFLALGFGLLAWPLGTAWVLVSLVLWTVGEMLNLPFVTGVIANRAGRRVGSYMGLYNVAFSVAFVLGPFLGTWAYGHWSPRAPWLACLIMAPLLGLGFLWLDRRSPALAAAPAPEPTSGGDSPRQQTAGDQPA